MLVASDIFSKSVGNDIPEACPRDHGSRYGPRSLEATARIETVCIPIPCVIEMLQFSLIASLGWICGKTLVATNIASSKLIEIFGITLSGGAYFGLGERLIRFYPNSDYGFTRTPITVLSER